MTIRAYISDKLRAFGVSGSQFADVALTCGLDPDAEVDAANAQSVGVAMCGVLEEMLLAPRQSNVNESGFSVSWDFSAAGKYYLWLCRRYGVTPDDEVVALLGISTITDRTDRW